MLGKLVGKVLGEVIALPATIMGEAAEAIEETIETADKAIERAGDKLEGKKSEH